MNIFKRTGTPNGSPLPQPDDDNAELRIDHSEPSPVEPDPAIQPVTRPSRPGAFIVIEGGDGPVRDTQFTRLGERLTQAGHDVARFDFPRHDEPSSHFVRRYQAGDYGTAEDVGPYVSSLFFALDRYAAAQDIRRALAAGRVVLANRYVGSTMAQQGAAFRRAAERHGFFVWLDNLEFDTLGVPRPDLSLILRGVEADPTGQAVNEAYDDLCQLFPKDYQRLDIVRGSHALEADAIARLVHETAAPYLPAPSGPVSLVHSHYRVPSGLPADVERTYRQYMDAITEHYDRLRDAIGATDPEAARAVLPVTDARPDEVALRLSQLAGRRLTGRYAGADNRPVVLSDVMPRNELDLAADMLYAVSDLSLGGLRREVGGWSYEHKAELVEAYLLDQPRGDVLAGVRYRWDLTCDYATYRELCQRGSGLHLQRQPLTPRLGFDVPTAVDEAGLGDLFEECFDLSLKAYSLLQQQGHNIDTAPATLQGHKLRCQLSGDARAVVGLLIRHTDEDVSPTLRRLLGTMREQLRQVHPLLTAASP